MKTSVEAEDSRKEWEDKRITGEKERKKQMNITWNRNE